jgi:glycosyltransferase involved in cell wall biosynthesis
MRVLTVCSSTAVFGAEIMSLNMLLAFQRRGYEQLAVTSSWTDGKFSDRLAALDVPEVALPIGVFSKRMSPRALWWTTNAAMAAPRLWFGWHRTIETFNPDVLLLTNPKQGLWLYPWLDRQASFLIEHSMKALSGANRWMYERLQSKLSGFVAVSRFMGSHLRDLGIDPERIHVIYNCCPSSGDDITSQPGPGPTSPARVGIAGQISPHKGHDLLLEAAKLLREKRVSFEIVVFGSGKEEYVSDLRRRIKLADLVQQWKWMGYCGEKGQIYRSMDICVVPSCFDEPFGMVALEASCYGLPVIAARRGGLPEIVIDGETGLLVDAEDSNDLAEKIAQLINDRDRAESMGEKGQRTVSHHFSQEKMVSDFEQLFLRSVAGR